MPYVPKNKNPRLKIIISTLVVLVVIAVLVSKSGLDPKAVGASLSGLNPLFLLLVFGMGLLQVLFWVLRPWPLIPKNSKLSFLNLTRAIALGQFLNSFAPARAGDVTKIFLLSSSKIKNPLPPSTAVGLLTADKLVDLIAIVILAAFSGAAASSQTTSAHSPYWFLLFLLPILLFVIWRFIPKAQKLKIKMWFEQFLLGLKPLLVPKAFCLSLLFAVCVWISEALALFFVLKAGGINVLFSDAVYLMCIVNLGILVPVSIANVGAFEAAFVYGVSKFNVPMESAVALALASHFLQACALTVWALAMFQLKGFRVISASDG